MKRVASLDLKEDLKDMSDNTIRPWYRQTWPWILIGIQLLGITLAVIYGVQATIHQDQVIERPAQKAMSKSFHADEESHP